MASFRCAISASVPVRSALAPTSPASAAMRAARSARIIAWAAARSAGSDSAITRPPNHIRRGLQAKRSADRGRTPSCLGMTPVDPRQKVAELGSRDRYRTIGGRRPQEAPPLQPLREQAGSLAIVPDHLQEIAPTPAEAEQVTAQGVAPQHLLDLQRQARKPLPHIRVPGRQPVSLGVEFSLIMGAENSLLA